jgi:hypothetical protein
MAEQNPTTDGEAMLAALDGVRDVFVRSAQLLRTADAYVATHLTWTPLLGSRALSDVSASLDRPHDWMPFEASRFYAVDACTVAFVAVLFGENTHRDTLAQPLTEPLVYGGWVRYEQARVGRFEHTWLSRMWHWMEVDAYRDGGASEVRVRVVEDKQVDGVMNEQGCTAPVGLVTLRTAGDLETTVLLPMSRAIEEISGAQHA